MLQKPLLRSFKLETYNIKQNRNHKITFQFTTLRNQTYKSHNKPLGITT
ncbi:unnamed protein product [Plutella xylostella]|uniref:(diamondback moth) hypothetical protein n=1 Tax=Plutella xylostella TaxID=51655 RepID=A0A8S4F2Y2_PLUXY|nr:unnamed protein product [Plutella xylostella]